MRSEAKQKKGGLISKIKGAFSKKVRPLAEVPAELAQQQKEEHTRVMQEAEESEKKQYESHGGSNTRRPDRGIAHFDNKAQYERRQKNKRGRKAHMAQMAKTRSTKFK